MATASNRWTCAPYSVAGADQVARELGVSHVTAAVLARRGYGTVEEVRRFLAADERHDPWLLGQMEEACELILGHVRRGSRIVVHGDYDVDGVCSTAILVEALRALGADPAWHLPARVEGYGLSGRTLERFARDGTGLLVTVDCGIAAPGEVDTARARGIDVVVTDHHKPGDRLPGCPVVHPALGYPFAGLCAAGVAHKLSAALRERAGLDGALADEELDLVGLATVCDLVPLRGENRRLVREGLRALARTRRPGLRALMRAAGLDGEVPDERVAGFRLGPRINAAGRLRRADAALELVLTSDEARAAAVADELDLLNRERRDAETRALFAAEAQRAAQDGAPAYVIAGDGWHPGVVGIVASRIAERHHRPCVVISLDEHGGGRGSGRSIPAFDLHAALTATSRNLRRFGGHRSAAGLEIDSGSVDQFRRDFVAYAAASLTPEDLTPVTEVDAVVPGSALGLPLAEELLRLAPFGQGNPEPALLVPAARVDRARSMGEEGQHSRFTLVSSGSRAEAVAFRTVAGSLRSGDELRHAAVRLEVSEWNRMVEARVVLSDLLPVEDGRCLPIEGGTSFWDRVEQELRRDLSVRSVPQIAATRSIRDRRGEGIAGVLGDLLSSGETVLVACADVARRQEALGRLVAGMAGCDGGSRGDGRRDAPARALPVACWEDLAEDPELAASYRHVVALDPPFEEAWLRLPPCGEHAGEMAFIHLAWGPAEIDFTLAVARGGLDVREAMAEAYRLIRGAGWVEGDALRAALAGGRAHPRRALHCGRLLRVLTDLRLVEYAEAGDGVPRCRTLAATRTALERSGTYRRYRERLREAERYLAAEAAAHRIARGSGGGIAASAPTG